MSVILQHRIYRTDLKNNPDILYLFGDNEQRRGRGGQAKECRGEPNAVGIATKVKPARSEESYWSDGDYDRCIEIIESDFERAILHAKAGGIIICPSDGLGSGLSELPTRAPRLFQYIQSMIHQIKAI